MINFKKLNAKKNILEEVMKLDSDFIEMYRNGQLQETLDMKYGLGLNNISFIEEKDILDMTRSQNAINLILNNGHMLELRKSNRKYGSKESILGIINTQYNKEYVQIKEGYLKGKTDSCSHFMGNLLDNLEAIISRIDWLYEIFSTSELPFQVEENRIYFCQELYDGPSYGYDDNGKRYYLGDKLLCVLELIFADNVVDIRNYKDKSSDRENKIIISNKTKQHMIVHQDDFQIPYHNLIKYMQSKGYFNNLKDGFVEMVVEFPFDIGYTSLVETDSTHNVFYAKRKNRDTYSRYTTNVEKRLTNRCVVILNQSYTNSNEYYLVTMFSGDHLIREVQDKNTKSEEERKKVIEFWSGHALILNADDIDINTVTRDCPYTEKV